MTPARLEGPAASGIIRGMSLAAFTLGLTVPLLASGWNIGAWLLSTGRAMCILLLGASRSNAIIYRQLERNGRIAPDEVARIAR